MKIFGFYISRTDWKYLFNYEREERAKLTEWACDVQFELQKYERPRDKSGRFISKSNNLHEQMRNYYNKPTDYAALKEASKIEEFGR
jgi:hypothetical protein